MSEVKIHGLSAEGEAYRTALVAIQEHHKARFIGTQEDGTPIYACMVCLVDDNGTCKTRRLADDALTARTTKNGDA